jgi:hypothetical protein
VEERWNEMGDFWSVDAVDWNESFVERAHTFPGRIAD